MVENILVGVFLGLIVVSFVLKIRKKENKKWVNEYPLTLAQYLKMYPNLLVGKKGIQCSNCGSRFLKSVGLFDENGSKRSVSCNHCGTKLYRIES